jgi:hypothetical protein
MSFFNNPPELTPNVDILFEWSDSKSHVILLNTCNIPTPLKESDVFLSLYFLSRHGLLPLWTSWYFQKLIFRILYCRFSQQKVSEKIFLGLSALSRTLENIFTVDYGDVLLGSESLV